MAQRRSHSHAGVHSLAIGSDLLVLKTSFDQIYWKDTCHANYPCNAAIYDLWKESVNKGDDSDLCDTFRLNQTFLFKEKEDFTRGTNSFTRTKWVTLKKEKDAVPTHDAKLAMSRTVWKFFNNSVSTEITRPSYSNLDQFIKTGMTQKQYCRDLSLVTTMLATWSYWMSSFRSRPSRRQARGGGDFTHPNSLDTIVVSDTHSSTATSVGWWHESWENTHENFWSINDHLVLVPSVDLPGWNVMTVNVVLKSSFVIPLATQPQLPHSITFQPFTASIAQDINVSLKR